MGCIAPLVFILGPRGGLILILLLTDWIGKAYETALIPILGFALFPWTTLAYIPAMYYNEGWDGSWTVLLIVAVLMDLGSWERCKHG